jgi:hypothetical protein
MRIYGERCGLDQAPRLTLANCQLFLLTGGAKISKLSLWDLGFSQVTMDVYVFWNVTPCILVDKQAQSSRP